MTDEEALADAPAPAEPAPAADEVEEPTRPMQMSEVFDDDE